jgi:nucleoside-diphosphate-sugar epimerase
MPLMIAAARRYGCGVHIGDGANRWSNVHVEDLADLYIAVLECGAPGVSYFAESGENSMQEIAAAISRTMGASATKSLTPEEATAEYGASVALLSLGSNSRVCGDHARRLGWVPKRPPLLSEIDDGWYRKDLLS